MTRAFIGLMAAIGLFASTKVRIAGPVVRSAGGSAFESCGGAAKPGKGDSNDAKNRWPGQHKVRRFRYAANDHKLEVSLKLRYQNVTAIFAGLVVHALLVLGHFYVDVLTQSVPEAWIPWFNVGDDAIDDLQGVVPAFVAGWISWRSGMLVGLCVNAVGALVLPFENAWLSGDYSPIHDGLMATLASLLVCGVITGAVAGAAASYARQRTDPRWVSTHLRGETVSALLHGFAVYLVAIMVNFYAVKFTIGFPAAWEDWRTAAWNVLTTLVYVAPAFVAGWVLRRKPFAAGATIGVLGALASTKAISLLLGYELRPEGGVSALTASLALSGIINGSMAGAAGCLARVGTRLARS